ncbi:MAG: hypothetical protein MMC33_007036 [Icmadophila ericetorum]|nr:hypothetical protein [Icmadophila ericetorum]
MPYNSSAITPPDEITGSAALPLARVKKILDIDEEINKCSNTAAFAITFATEMFIRYFAEQGHNVVKSETKPRRNIQYRDLANAVARIDNLEFLSDVVPRTMTYREFKEKKAARAKKVKPLQSGQTTLDGKRPSSSHLPKQMVISDTPMEDSMPVPASEPVAPKRPSTKVVNGAPPNSLVFQHYDPNSKSKRGVSSGDVEMS